LGLKYKSPRQVRNRLKQRNARERTTNRHLNTDAASKFNVLAASVGPHQGRGEDFAAHVRRSDRKAPVIDLSRHFLNLAARN